MLQSLIIFNFVLFSGCLSAAAPVQLMDWVGLYKDGDTSLIVDQCNTSTCVVTSEHGDGYPEHIRQHCESEFKFHVHPDHLTYDYRDAHGKKISTLRLKKKGILQFSGYTPYVPKDGEPDELCHIPAGNFIAVYDKSKASEIADILPACQTMTDSHWFALCFDARLYESIRDLSKISKKTSKELFDFLGADGQVGSGGWQNKLEEKIVEILHPRTNKPKILTTVKFEGMFETQKSGHSRGRKCWTASLSFLNCRGRICDVDYFHSQQVPSPSGKANFESETKIRLDECGDEPLYLEKKNGEWAIDEAKGCSLLQDVSMEPFKPYPLYATSFNCFDKNITSLERVICKSERLASLDQYLTSIFKELPDSKTKIQEQKEWLSKRNQCDKVWPQDQEACLVEQYNQRIYQLFKAKETDSK